jgi:hypothetical protein
MNLKSRLEEIEYITEIIPEKLLLGKIQHWAKGILSFFADLPDTDPSTKYIKDNSSHFFTEASKHSENYFKEPFYNSEKDSSIYPSNLAPNSFKRGVKYLQEHLKHIPDTSAE